MLHRGYTIKLINGYLKSGKIAPMITSGIANIATPIMAGLKLSDPDSNIRKENKTHGIAAANAFNNHVGRLKAVNL